MIQNARIISEDTSVETYCAESAKRGEREFVVRSHVLSEILRNAQRWMRGYESPESKALKFGSLLDCKLFTPRAYHANYCVVPADAPRRPSKAQINAAKPSPQSVADIKWWKEWTNANPGEQISNELNGAVLSASMRLSEDKTIVDLIQSSRHQVMITAEWVDKPTGLTVPVKCLIDILPPEDHPVFSNSLWDLKTTANASPRSFSRDAQKYRYDLQGRFYLDLFNAATGEQRTDFGHVVIENYHPYEYRTPPPLMSQRFLDFGRLSYQSALGIYCRGLATGEWPGYDQGKGWPITDCDDWHLNADALYQPIEEPEEDEEIADEQPAEMTP